MPVVFEEVEAQVEGREQSNERETENAETNMEYGISSMKQLEKKIMQLETQKNRVFAD